MLHKWKVLKLKFLGATEFTLNKSSSVCFVFVVFLLSMTVI